MGKHRKPLHRKQVIYDDLPPMMAPPPYPPPPFEPKPVVNIDVLGAKNATVAKVTLAKHQDWTAAGTVYRFEVAEASKREQGDVSDPKTGELLALARAFQRLSRDLFREGHKRVQKASEERAAAEEAAEAKARHLPVEVHRRTKEEWEKIQRRAELFNMKPEETVTYNPHDAEILGRWVNKEAHDIESLKAEKKRIEETLRLLGEAE